MNSGLKWALCGNLMQKMLFEMQLVELKNGETYNGHLVNCDTWMNIHLREVICTSKVGMFFPAIACLNIFLIGNFSFAQGVDFKFLCLLDMYCWVW
jgi:small nuclear ribonucleoprotein (snRNP)-like protein